MKVLRTLVFSVLTEPYLPLDWCQDVDRRNNAHIPESVRFQTKPELAGMPSLSPPLPVHLEQQTEGKPVASRPLIEAELRARSRMPPLIEYSAQGTYVVISSPSSELSLMPASREWFDWLATLSSFRFVGQSGRFTAYRETNHGKPTRGWIAHRSLYGRHYKHWLGVTDRLTIDHLEQMAAHLHSRLTTL